MLFEMYKYYFAFIHRSNIFLHEKYIRTFFFVHDRTYGDIMLS